MAGLFISLCLRLNYFAAAHRKLRVCLWLSSALLALATVCVYTMTPSATEVVISTAKASRVAPSDFVSKLPAQPQADGVVSVIGSSAERRKLKLQSLTVVRKDVKASELTTAAVLVQATGRYDALKGLVQDVTQAYEDARVIRLDMSAQVSEVRANIEFELLAQPSLGAGK
jgi:hypothetical protein